MGLLLDIMVSDPAMPVDESERKSDPGFRRRGRALFSKSRRRPYANRPHEAPAAEPASAQEIDPELNVSITLAIIPRAG